MYFPLTIDDKPIFLKHSGISIKDLTQLSYVKNDMSNSIFDAYWLPTRFEMRIDLVAKHSYNNPTKAELVMKYNNISNPFSIEQGDSIIAVDAELGRKNFNKETKSEALSKKIRDQFIDPTKKPKQNTKFKEFRSRDLSLPPNISKTGEGSVIIKDGKITVGADVTSPNKKQTLKETPTERRKFETLLKTIKKSDNSNATG